MLKAVLSKVTTVLISDSTVFKGFYIVRVGIIVENSTSALATAIYEDAARLSRLIARLVVALAVSFALALLIGFVSFSIIASSHHSVVR